MENNYSLTDLEKILIEDNELKKIFYPSINPEENNEKFEGKIIDNKSKKGKYTWKNGQIFFGNLSENNKFIKKGKIIFPNNDELIGVFNENINIITKAIYNTSTRLYQGSFKKNKLDGKFVIKNKENSEHYIYIGNYFNGVKDGKFTLEKIYNNKKIKVSGTFDRGKKSGLFKIFELTDIQKDGEKKTLENEVYSEEFLNNYIKSKLIESKEFFEYKEKRRILCMEIIQKDNVYLLLGSYKYLLIYIINIDQDEIILNDEILLFRNSEINDVIKLEEDRLLLCSSDNCFKLIELNIGQKNDIMSNLNSVPFIENNCKLLQEFKGEPNSKNIFCLYELSNNLIASGDCENIIIWKKNFRIGKTINSFVTPYELSIFAKKEVSHTYCMLRINNDNDNNIILAVAQPHSKSIEILEIQENKQTINEIKTIFKVNSIPNRKNIMTKYHNNLIVGCKNKVIIIDINKYEIINDIYSREYITYIGSYSNEFLLFGTMKEISQYNYEGYLSQEVFFNDSKGQQNINTISIFNKSKYEGNIINSCKYIINNNEYIIAIGTDGKILIIK